MGLLRNILIIILFLLLTQSCHKRKIHLEVRNYTGNELRIDGYYYNFLDNSQDKINATYFFYRNGVIINGSGYDKSDENTWQQNWINGQSLASSSHYKFTYGVFLVEGNNIKIESWTNINIPETYVVEGAILNDTTFHLSSTYRLTKRGKKKQIKSIDELYHFKQLTPKPDSTNNFVP